MMRKLSACLLLIFLFALVSYSLLFGWSAHEDKQFWSGNVGARKDVYYHARVEEMKYWEKNLNLRQLGQNVDTERVISARCNSLSERNQVPRSISSKLVN